MPRETPHPDSLTAGVAASTGALPRSLAKIGRGTAMTLGPLALALIPCGIVLLATGVNPLAYYALVVRQGLLNPIGVQETVTQTAPLMLLGASLILSFRAGLWNLGVDGQFLLGAMAAAAAAPWLVGVMPDGPALILAMLIAMLAAAAWSLLPAWLRAYGGINEIITTLMMNFLGLSLVNLLIKLVFIDPATTLPVTRTLAVADRLPHLFGSTIDIGIILALVLLAAVHLGLTRTAWGLRVRLLGANPRAARHAGLPVPAMILGAFLLSAALAGLAGAIMVLGTLGNVRADWDPGYGFTVIPLVFLARLNGWAVIGFVFAFAMLSIGAQSAAIRLGVPQYFTFLLVGLLLLFLALVDALGQRASRQGA
jgi:simple sugar transport system permease protein